MERFISVHAKDRAALIAQSKTGEVDLAEIEPSEIREVESQSNLQVTRYFALGVTYLAYNTRQPGPEELPVRHALSHALDRKVIIDDVMLGEGWRMTSDIPPDSWAFNRTSRPSTTTEPGRGRCSTLRAGRLDRVAYARRPGNR